MKKLLAVFLALHGLAHLVGLTTAWKLVEPEAAIRPRCSTVGGRSAAP